MLVRAGALCWSAGNGFGCYSDFSCYNGLGCYRSISGSNTFDTSEQTADALGRAAGQFDETALAEIFGPDSDDIAFTADVVQDRQRAADFAAEAREKTKVAVDPKNALRAYVLMGDEGWPFRPDCEERQQMVLR